MASKPSHTLKVLSENLSTLMAAHATLNTDGKLAAAAKMDQKTVWRIVNRQNEPSLDKLERLAKAFGLEPWQLLVPGISAGQRPELTPEVAIA